MEHNANSRETLDGAHTEESRALQEWLCRVETLPLPQIHLNINKKQSTYEVYEISGFIFDSL